MLMDVCAIERQRIFCCDAPQASHAEVANVFCDHGLAWRAGRVHTVMSRLKFDQLEMYVLEYGAEVEVRPRAFGDFMLIHFSLSGNLGVDGGGFRVDRKAGEAILLGRQSSLRMEWAEGTRQLILKIPNAAFAGEPAAPPYCLLDAEQSRQLGGLLQAMLYSTSLLQDRSLQNSWVSSLEQSVLIFTRQLLSRPGTPAEPPTHESRLVLRDQRRVDRLLDYVRAHLSEPISLDDMARAADLSSRGLFLLCQRHLDNTPMSVVRELRLEAVRGHLQGSPHRAVTEVALEYGFGHLGRFANYYRRRFGELPSDTQRGSQVPAPAQALPSSADRVHSLQ